MYHIEDFAQIATTSRREVDRVIADGDIPKFKWHGVTLVPAEALNQFAKDGRERPERRQQPTRGVTTRPEAETAAATPWEELTYEPR